jgi:hypothetical protein
MNKLNMIVVSLLTLLVLTGVTAATSFFIEDSSSVKQFWVYDNGNVSANGILDVDSMFNVNLSGSTYTGTLGGGNITADSLEKDRIADSGTLSFDWGDDEVSDTLTASDLQAGSEVVADSEVVDTITIDGGTINLGSNTYSSTLGYDNLTKCSDTEILKVSGANWVCAADDDSGGADTDTNASSACSGTTTYLDGEGNCDDVAPVYADIAGDIFTGVLNMSATNLTLSNSANITDSDSDAMIRFENGNIVMHLGS